jgi:predicted kinase
MMNKFYMMIGVPGSGKSTIAEEIALNEPAVIVSSDVVRGDLYGDESIQGDPAKVFRIVHENVKHYLRKGCNVIMDATNINSKKRAAFLREINKVCPDCRKIAVVVAADKDTCVSRDLLRERIVGYEVIERMIANFQPPFYYEGWDKIEYHNTSKPVDLDGLFDHAMKFDQCNHHHTLTLGEHMRAAATYVDDFVDYIAAYCHDIGKLYCQTFDDEGEAHYYNHHHIGAYVWLCSDLCWDWMHNDRVYSAWWVAQLICWHMTPYQCMSKEGFILWATRRGMPEDLVDSIWKLHEADKEAH